MSLFSDLLGDIANQIANGQSSGNRAENCDWYCDECGVFMNNQPGFTVASGTWKCTACGAENDVTEDNIISDDYNDDDDDDIPEGCRACGGPYPSCMSSCPIFDD